MTRRVKRLGFIYDGKLLNWETEPEDLIRVTKDNRVMIDDIEIVPWSTVLKQSLRKRQWYTVGSGV